MFPDNRSPDQLGVRLPGRTSASSIDDGSDLMSHYIPGAVAGGLVSDASGAVSWRSRLRHPAWPLTLAYAGYSYIAIWPEPCARPPINVVHVVDPPSRLRVRGGPVPGGSFHRGPGGAFHARTPNRNSLDDLIQIDPVGCPRRPESGERRPRPECRHECPPRGSTGGGVQTTPTPDFTSWRPRSPGVHALGVTRSFVAGGDFGSPGAGG